MDPLEGSTSTTGLPGLGSGIPSRSPSPPLLIRLVSPPTPRSTSRSSLNCSTDSEEAAVATKMSSKLSEPCTSPYVGEPHDFASFPTFPSSSSSTNRVHPPTPSTLRSSTPTFRFSTLFSSVNSNARLPSVTKRPVQPRTNAYKIRSPSLVQTNRTNVGKVKQTTLGLARRMSLSFKGKGRNTKLKNEGKNHPSLSQGRLRKIEEQEFPNSGALVEARKAREKEETKKGRSDARRRSVNPIQTPVHTRPRPSLGSSSGRFSSPCVLQPPAPSKPTPRSVTRKVKPRPRVSFPRTTPTSSSAVRSIIDRPRPVPRRRNQTKTPIFEGEEEGEWLDECPELQLSDTRYNLPTSATPCFQRLPFLRSYAPTTPLSSNSSPRALESTLSPPRSLEPSDESFQCRGDFPFTPSDQLHRSPVIPQSRVVRPEDCQFSPRSPRNALHIPIRDPRQDDSSSSLFSPSRSKLRGGGRQANSNRDSISPGDLTRFLDELLLEEAKAGQSQLEGVQEEDGQDVFADAEEPNWEEGARDLKRQIETEEEAREEDNYDFEISTATIDRSTSSSAAFKLSLPPRRPNTVRVSVPSPVKHGPSILLPLANLFESQSSTCQKDEQAQREPTEPVQLLSASRETFVRGQLVRKGSLLSFVSPPSSAPPSPSPSSIFDTSVTEASIFAQLQARPRFPLVPLFASPPSHPQFTSLGAHRPDSQRSARGTITPELPPQTAPLPFVQPLASPGPPDHFLTAPSTPLNINDNEQDLPRTSSPSLTNRKIPTGIASSSFAALNEQFSNFSSFSNDENNDKVRSPLSTIVPQLPSPPVEGSRNLNKVSHRGEEGGGRNRGGGGGGREVILSERKRKKRRETMLPLEFYQDSQGIEGGDGAKE